MWPNTWPREQHSSLRLISLFSNWSDQLVWGKRESAKIVELSRELRIDELDLENMENLSFQLFFPDANNSNEPMKTFLMFLNHWICWTREEKLEKLHRREAHFSPNSIDYRHPIKSKHTKRSSRLSRQSWVRMKITLQTNWTWWDGSAGRRNWNYTKKKRVEFSQKQRDPTICKVVTPSTGSKSHNSNSLSFIFDKLTRLLIIVSPQLPRAHLIIDQITKQ